MKPGIFSRPWLQILIIGVVLFIAAEQAMRLTGNPNFFPTVILIGSFVVPVTFITYFFDNVRHRHISMPLLTACFVVGGVIGLITAGILEYQTLRGMDALELLGVGIIEESAKLIFPIIMYIRWRYHQQADGLLFGIASGMGFAALETMGYGLVSFIQSGGDVDTLQQVLLFRGLLSPAGHAAWTGFVCAVLWRERERKGRVAINFKVIGAFITAIILHTLWNTVNSLAGPTILQLSISIGGSIVVAGISLTLLIRRYRESRELSAT